MIACVVLFLLVPVSRCLSFDYDHVLSTQLPKVLWNETNQDKLKKDLFVNYDRHARPHEHGVATTVQLDLVVLHVESNEVRSTITVHALVKVFWNDPKLKWNKEDYGGIDVLRVADHELWHPDLFLYNSALGGEPVFRYGNPNALVHPNGEVQIVLRAKQTVLCEFDLSRWPYDTQHCSLTYVSWIYTGEITQLSLYDDKTTAEVDHSFPFSSWNVVNTTAEVVITKHACCVDLDHIVNYNLTLVRNHKTYVAVCLTPAVVSALLVSMQFWLPPGGRPKSYINGFLIVIFITQLIYFTDKISRATKHLPLIVLFYIYNLYAVTLAVLIDVLGIYSTESRRCRFFETFVEKHVAKRFPLVFFARQNLQFVAEKNDIADERLLNVGIDDMPRSNKECFFFASFLNRLMFLIYLTVLCIGIFALK